MPILAREHEGHCARMLGGLGLGGEADAGLDVAALGVEAVELLRDRVRALGVVGEQELQRPVRARDPTGRVDARREAEGDGGRV